MADKTLYMYVKLHSKKIPEKCLLFKIILEKDNLTPTLKVTSVFCSYFGGKINYLYCPGCPIACTIKWKFSWIYLQTSDKKCTSKSKSDFASPKFGLKQSFAPISCHKMISITVLLVSAIDLHQFDIAWFNVTFLHYRIYTEPLNVTW
jgi:hypothetical protein